MSKYASKEALLKATDLEERDVDLPLLGFSVRIRALPADYSNQAQSEALVSKQIAGSNQVITTVDKGKMEVIQIFHGLVDPKLDTMEEAQQFAKNCGPSFAKVIETLDEISGVDKEAIEKAQARFPGLDAETPAGAPENNGDADPAGSGGSDVPSRSGAEAG